MWPLFTAALTPWFTYQLDRSLSTSGVATVERKGMEGLSALDGADASATAEVITAEYQLAMRLAVVVPYMNPILPGRVNGWKKGPFLNGFKQGFKMMAESPNDLGIAPYMLMAAGVVASWVGPVKFQPAPPHPPNTFPNGMFLPDRVCHTVTPGLPFPLTSMIQAAFTCGSASMIAPLLVSAFSAHLMTIGGVYNGMIPIAPPPMITAGPPVPWYGVM
jgi:hypothetical protein